MAIPSFRGIYFVPDNYDSTTDIVYISDQLKVTYKDTYHRFTRLLDEMKIDWREIPDTRDIWVRDFMPIQLHDGSFVLYRYYPDYLDNDQDRPYITDAHNACQQLGIEYSETSLLLDGGNVTPCGSTYVLTEKCLGEDIDRTFNLIKLKRILEAEPIIIPWHCEGPGGDVYGHSDGMVHWCGGRRILMSNHRETHPGEAQHIRDILESYGFEVTEMLFDKVGNKHPEWNWAYVNYLQVGKKIIMPSFGIAEDRYALKYVQEANPDCEVRQIRLRNIASCGGALHCITWNIKQHLPF